MYQDHSHPSSNPCDQGPHLLITCCAAFPAVQVLHDESLRLVLEEPEEGRGIFAWTMAPTAGPAWWKWPAGYWAPWGCAACPPPKPWACFLLVAALGRSLWHLLRALVARIWHQERLCRSLWLKPKRPKP